MILRILLSLVAIFFPWLTLLLEDNPGGAVVALIMQASVIGWPFASIWALRVINEKKRARKAEKKQQTQTKTEQ